VSWVRSWSSGEVESQATMSQVVLDDGCRQSATSARRAVVYPRRAKQQARRRAPRWLVLQRGQSDRQPLYRGNLTASLCIGGTALVAGRTASCGDPGRKGHRGGV
jgi:hypothetical protein